MNNVILAISEFANFVETTFGLGRPLSFYQNLAKTGQLKNSFKGDNNRWYVKVDACFFQAKDVQNIIDENIRFKETLKNIKKLID